MSNADTTLPMAQPPISSSTDAQPQETLLQRGMFDPPVTPGTLGHLDRFEILRLLGEGGMGQVYLAREPRTDTRVAVKLLRPQMADDPQSVHRFLTEARHMYRLSHPRILRVLEVSDRKEGPYYVMPYVEGGSLLGQYRPGKPMPTERILAIASQVAEALAHAHAHGLIHRDLKPGNVLLDKDGNAYLTDFGLVRTVFNDSMVDASASHLEGTAPYMSPAVARGEAEDTRCDIYAFGALLYELIAGQPPYTGRTCQIILDQVLKGPPTPLREVNPKASPALVKIAEGCLARELHARYTTMTDVVSDLARAAKGVLPLGPHQQEQRRRLPRLAALLAVTLAFAALAGVAVHHFSAGTRSTRPQQTGVQSPASGVLAQIGVPAANASLSGDEPVIEEDDADKGVPPDARALSPTAKVQGPFSYTVTNGAVTLVKYSGPGGNVTIPRTINGLPVTTLGTRSFAACTNLTSIALSDSITTISWEAFKGCTRLNTLTIPKSVTSITGNAFAGCSGLDSFSVDMTNPAYCSSADGVVFSKDRTMLIRYPTGKQCNYLIPYSVSTIGHYAFQDCAGLTSIMIPGRVIHIGDGAFEKCEQLTSMTLPSSVISLGYNVSSFLHCSALTSIVVEAANTAYSSNSDGVLFSKDKTKLVCYPGGRAGSYGIPDTVTHIGHSAFKNCASLCDVTIPSKLAFISPKAFQTCPNLTGLFFNGNAPNLGKAALDDIPNATIYYLPGTTGWGTELGGRPTAVWNQDVQIPYTYTTHNGAITITKYTGPGGDVTIPSTINGHPVTSIGDYAFADCPGLTSIMIPKGVISVSGGAFPFCDKFTSIGVDPANPAYCSENGVLFNKAKTCLAIYPRGKTGSYSVPYSVTEIGFMAFWNCHKLTSVEMGNGVKRIACGAFGHCTGLTSMTIPDSVTCIEGEAFCKCRLTDITVPKSVTSIEGNPFNGCGGLSIRVDAENPAYYSTADGIVFSKDKSYLVSYPSDKKGDYVIPDSVTNFGSAAFRDCTGLTGVTIPNSVTKINQFVFQGCTNLTSVTIPSSVSSIGRASFAGCNSLTGITIPDSVKAIEAAAFEYCPNLASVYFNGDAPSGGSDSSVFGGSEKITVYYLPGTKGWGPTFGGRPTAVWQEKAQAETDVHDFACLAENGGVAIVKYTGEGGAVVIPAKVNGLPVTAIKDTAFQKCAGVTRIVIPAHVTSIASGVFMNCTNLDSILVDVLNPVYASSADGVLFSKDKTGILCYPRGKKGDYSIPKTVTTIGDDAFNRCEDLSAVMIPNGVSRISAGAFAFSTRLTSITIPASVINMTPWAFTGCSGLKSIQVDEANPVFFSNRDGVVFSKDNKTLVRFPSGRNGNYTIPSHVSRIGAAAFIGSTVVTGVTIPNGVTGIESSAFQSCPSLRSLTIPDSVTTIGDCAFMGSENLVNVTLPNRLTRIELWTFVGCAITNMTIPASVTFIGDHAFACPTLTNIVIPNSVTNIAGWAFNCCFGLKSVSIPDSITTIENGIFANCTNLTEVTVPNSVTNISAWAFRDCTSLTNITLPGSVAHIGNEAFVNCPQLTRVYFKGDAPGGATDRSIFQNSNKATIYYRPGTKGWGPTFGGRPTAVWKP